MHEVNAIGTDLVEWVVAIGFFIVFPLWGLRLLRQDRARRAAEAGQTIAERKRADRRKAWADFLHALPVVAVPWLWLWRIHLARTREPEGGGFVVDDEDGLLWCRCGWKVSGVVYACLLFAFTMLLISLATPRPYEAESPHATAIFAVSGLAYSLPGLLGPLSFLKLSDTFRRRHLGRWPGQSGKEAEEAEERWESRAVADMLAARLEISERRARWLLRLGKIDRDTGRAAEDETEDATETPDD